MIRRFWLVPVLLSILLVTVLGVAVAGEKKAKAFLGIVPAEVTSDIATDYGLKGPGAGVLVTEVTSNSPAKKIGLRDNDIITKINRAAITGPDELRIQLAKYKPGDKVDLVYLRGGKEKTAEVELADKSKCCKSKGMKIWKDLEGLRMEAPSFEWHGQSEKVAFAGIVTQELSEGLAKYFAVEKGALISEVVEDSPAEEAGLKAGDIITQIGDEEVEDQGDVRDAIREHDIGDEVDFNIRRDKVPMTIKVKLGEREWGGLIPGTIDISPEIDDINLMIGIKDQELEDLKDELRQIEIELKDLPDLEMIELPEPPAIIRMDISSAEPVRNEPGWRATLNQFQNRLQETMLQMRLEIEYMKYKILEMKDRILQATT